MTLRQDLNRYMESDFTSIDVERLAHLGVEPLEAQRVAAARLDELVDLVVVHAERAQRADVGLGGDGAAAGGDLERVGLVGLELQQLRVALERDRLVRHGLRRRGGVERRTGASSTT